MFLYNYSIDGTSSNGRTSVFGSDNEGSNPSVPICL